MANPKTLGLLIGTAIAILMGAILVAIVSDTIVTKTDLTYTSVAVAANGAGPSKTENDFNESYINALGSTATVTGWRNDIASECTPVIVMTNVTGIRFGILNTDYKYYPTNGSLVMLNTSTTVSANTGSNASIAANFGYCGDEYVSSWGRTVTNLVPGFFALAVMIAGAFLIYYIAKSEGFEL